MKRQLFAVLLSVIVVVMPVAKAEAASTDGRILLAVENHGETWYVDPASSERYFLNRGEGFLAQIPAIALGISNANIWRIPVGVLSVLPGEVDSDRDGLTDQMEDALGTHSDYFDYDHDGYSDAIEYANGYSPFGKGKIPVDTALVKRLQGRILLQVEGRGEAWYVNPTDGRRYFVGNAEEADRLIQMFSLGITNTDLAKIAVSTDSDTPGCDSSWRLFTSEEVSFCYPADVVVQSRGDSEFVNTEILVAKAAGKLTTQEIVSMPESYGVTKTYNGITGVEFTDAGYGGISAFVFRMGVNTYSIVEAKTLSQRQLTITDWRKMLGSLIISQ